MAFIVPHLGSFADDWRAQLAVIDQLVRAPQRVRRHLGRAALRPAGGGGAPAGPGKILFGTDGPWLHPGVELAKVRALGLPAGAERLIVAGNLLRLTARARGRGRPAETAPGLQGCRVPRAAIRRP